MFKKLFKISAITLALISTLGQQAVADGDDQIDLENPETPGSLKYGKECARQLAPIPAFSCLDGKILPITVNGVEVHEVVGVNPMLELGD